MNIQIHSHKVYATTNNHGYIMAINSDLFLSDTTGWTQIDEGDGDRFMHAQGNYLPKPLMDERGRYRYKLVDGTVVERTPDEIAGDELPAADPIAALQAENALLRAQIQAVSDRGDFVEDCITEMADKVYGDA